MKTEWEKNFTVAVHGARSAIGGMHYQTTYYTSKGPASWKIDDKGNLNIQYYSVDGADIPLATHLAGTWCAVSQQEVDEDDDTPDEDESDPAW